MSVPCQPISAPLSKRLISRFLSLTGAMQVQAPATSLPTDAQFYTDESKTKPDIAFLKNHLYREGRLTEEQAIWLLKAYVPSSSKRCGLGVGKEAG